MDDLDFLPAKSSRRCQSDRTSGSRASRLSRYISVAARWRRERDHGGHDRVRSPRYRHVLAGRYRRGRCRATRLPHSWRGVRHGSANPAGERVTAPAESLRGGVAVVTGGAGTGAGLGRGLVMALSGRGIRVAVLDIDLDAATDVVEQVRSEGGEAIACKVDVAEPETLRWAAEVVGSTFGACNVLCAHAVAGVNPLADDLWSPDEWRRAMDGIVVGTVATVHAFLPLLRQTRGLRRVVFTASSVALAPGRFQGPYRAGKVAVVSIAESLARTRTGGHRYHDRVSQRHDVEGTGRLPRVWR